MDRGHRFIINRPYVGVRNMLFSTLLSQKTMRNNALLVE